MRALRLLAPIALILSYLLISKSNTLGGYENWCPVRLPLPGNGLEVYEYFHISSAGNFRLQVMLPRGKSSEPMSMATPLIYCDLQLEIKDASGNITKQSVKALNPGATNYLIDEYSTYPLNLPKSGGYSFRLRNNGEFNPLGTQGASIALTRFTTEQTARTELGSNLSIMGFLLFAVGLLASILVAVQEFTKNRSVKFDA